MPSARRFTIAAAALRALECKRCGRVLREGSGPVLWRTCDACLSHITLWDEIGPELVVIAVVALGVGVWLWLALRGWI